MHKLIAVGLLTAGAWWVGCSRGKCDERDAFGQKIERSDDAQARCDADNSPSSPTDNSGGGTGESGGGSTGGGSGGGGSSGGGGDTGPDTTAPTIISFAKDSTQQPQTSDLPIMFKVQFSEVIDPATFSAIDVTNQGTSTAVTWKVTNSGDSKTFTISVMNSTFGSLQPRIQEGGLADLAGNLNTARFDSSDSVNFVSGPLRITINQAPYQVDPAELAPIDFVVVFSRPIYQVSFTVSDITNMGTSTGISWQVAQQDDLTWYIAANSISSAGTVTPYIASGTIMDTNGITNTASTGQDGTVTYQPNP